ncbi:MAG TPA: sialidase family protein [Bryobacteraceae bacterium]|nr:sialidase family protein [Bryobacteraceae bacterium]
MRLISSLAVAAALIAGIPASAQTAAEVTNVHVYKQPGRYGGWPANHGIWSWGNEIVVGFEAGYFKANEQGHAIDRAKPAEHFLARSLDGGRTWAIEKPEGLKPPPGVSQADVPTEQGKAVTGCPGGIDFTAKGFALTARMANINVGPSRFYYSLDKGKTWNGPFSLPDFGQPGIAARTDYLVNGKHDLTMFLTAAKSNKREGRVIAVRTRDGGKTWTLEGMVGPEPEGNDFAIMPSSVRLSKTTILTAIRHRTFIDLYRSTDDGKTWSLLAKPAPNTGRGNPPSMIKLKDGRLALIYGYRAEPYGIRARLSNDSGATWSDEIILRKDAGNWDLGYPRSVQRPDGKIVTIYYYNDSKDSDRYIGATIWDPGKGSGTAR